MKDLVSNFIVFLAAYTLSQFYRSFLAVIAPELAAEISLSPQALGNLQALWIAGFVAMQFPVGYLLDRQGPRRSVPIVMVAAVIGSLLFATARDSVTAGLAMLLIGVGCSAIYMGAIFVFGRINRPDQFALLCSWLLGLGSAGNLLAASPLAHAAQAFGWRATMVAIGLSTAASALSVFLLIRDPPRLAASSGSGFLQGVASVLKIRELWPLLPLTGVSYAVILAERGLWAGPYFSAVHGLDPLERGDALLVMAAAMSIGAMVYGPLDRLFGTRKWIVVAGNTVTAVGFLCLALLPLGLAQSITLMAVIGAFGMTYGVLMAHGRSFLPDALLGRGITLLNILFIGGAGLLLAGAGVFVYLTSPKVGELRIAPTGNGLAIGGRF